MLSELALRGECRPTLRPIDSRCGPGPQSTASRAARAEHATLRRPLSTRALRGWRRSVGTRPRRWMEARVLLREPGRVPPRTVCGGGWPSRAVCSWRTASMALRHQRVIQRRGGADGESEGKGKKGVGWRRREPTPQTPGKLRFTHMPIWLDNRRARTRIMPSRRERRLPARESTRCYTCRRPHTCSGLRKLFAWQLLRDEPHTAQTGNKTRPQSPQPPQLRHSAMVARRSTIVCGAGMHACAV